MAEVLQPTNSSLSAPHSDAQLAEHLEAVCTSPAFAGSNTLRNLLRYLYDQRNQQISEYMIAVEALGRKPDFDPQVDATVRVQISRLRRRLKDYYLAEGKPQGIRLSVPLGTHQLVIDAPEGLAGTSLIPLSPVAPGLAAAAPPPPLARRGRTVPILVTLVGLLAALSLWQFWQLRSRSQTSLPAAHLQLLPFWKEFLANGKGVEIVLPNPTFLTWGSPEGRGLIARDTEVNTYADAVKSPRLATLLREFGKPQLAQFYAVSSDVLASTKLMRYLNAREIDANIAISSDASADIFESGNVILTGTPGTLSPFRSYLDRLYFRFAPEGGQLFNPSPLASEPPQFDVTEESPSRIILPGLIAYIPGPSPGSHLLIVAGRETAALMAFLTSTQGSEDLAQARRRAGNGPYFEAVILSEMAGYTVLNNHLVAFRAFPSGKNQR